MKKRLGIALAALAALPALAEQRLDNELSLVESWLASQRAYDRIPGLSAAIVHDQELLWSGASGLADVAAGEPARADTIYGICSISKLFTGIAAMQLRDQGKFRLDDPVEKLLPWYNLDQAFEGSPDITLEAMLTHSAGLPREADTPYWMGPDFEFPSREQVRELMSGQATLYPAQRYYQYSNLGLTLVGEVVAETSGQDFEAYVAEHILEPLGLRDTSTGFPTDAREPRVATGYGYQGRAGDPPVMPRYDARGITPAAGFASTALDLARFASWQFRLLNGGPAEVLSGNTLREMQRVHWLDPDWSIGRGLAFGVYRVDDRTLIGHSGDCPGFDTRLYIEPVSRYGVVVMTNRNRVDVDAYAAAIYNIIEAGGAPTGVDVNLDWGDYLGSYDARPWDGEDLVFRWKDSLAVVAMPTMDPAGGLTELKHIGGDRFHVVRSDGEAGHQVEFRRDESGQVTHLVYHGVEYPRY